MLYGVKPNDPRLDTAITSVDIRVLQNVFEPIQFFNKDAFPVSHHSSVFVEDVKKDESLYDIFQLIFSFSLRVFLNERNKSLYPFDALLRKIILKVFSINHLCLKTTFFSKTLIVIWN